jgi:CpeT protein
MMRASLLSLLLLGSLNAAAAAADATVARLATLLTGAFTNEAQAHSDFNYRPVVLHVVRIWPERMDGPWLYLEQALANAPTQPYRQQVYQLAATGEGQIEVRVFNLRDPIALTGAWSEAKRFEGLSPDNLVARAGCSLHLKAQPDGSIKGATEGNGCVSELRSAASASTELTVAEHELVIWDRGFDAAGTQVWGPAFSGYVFTRVE